MSRDSGTTGTRAQFSRDFGISSPTFDRATAGLEPCGRRGGRDVYALREVLPRLIGYVKTAQVDPATMPPHARLAAARADHEQIKIARMLGELCERHDVEQTMAAQLKIIVRWTDTLPDVLERSGVIDGPASLIVESSLDDAREELAKHLADYSARNPTEATTHA